MMSLKTQLAPRGVRHANWWIAHWGAPSSCGWGLCACCEIWQDMEIWMEIWSVKFLERFPHWQLRLGIVPFQCRQATQTARAQQWEGSAERQSKSCQCKRSEAWNKVPWFGASSHLVPYPSMMSILFLFLHSGLIHWLMHSTYCWINKICNWRSFMMEPPRLKIPNSDMKHQPSLANNLIMNTIVNHQCHQFTTNKHH